MNDKILDRKMICPSCGEQVEFNKDDILTENDWLDATDIAVKSLRCPYCYTRNIISVKDRLGKVTTYIKIEPFIGTKSYK